MAILRRATVSGLAGQDKSHDIRFNRDVNVFWGPNGCGKTSFLKILHSALQGDASYLVRVPLRKAEVAFFEHRQSRDFTRTLSFPGKQGEVPDDPIMENEVMRLFRQGEGEGEGLSWKIRPNNDGKIRRFPHQYLPVSRVASGRAAQRNARDRFEMLGRVEMLDEASFDEMFAEGIRNTWREYSTDELLTVRRIQDRGLAGILKGVIDRNPQGEETDYDIRAEDAFDAVANFFHYQKMGRLENRERFVQNFQTDPVQRQIVAEIVSIQARIEAAQEPTRRVEALLRDLFTGGKKVSLTTNELVVEARGSKIPVASLSSGEKQMVRLLVECVAAGEDAVIIDEPEISMHVDWQHRLIDSLHLVNPKAQIILATHSPEVMAQLDDERIFEL